MKTLAIFLTLSLLLISCASRQSQEQASLRTDEIAAAISGSPAAKAAVKADEHALAVTERLSERRGLLRMAVASVAVVAACLAASAYFPMLSFFLKLLAGAAGIFAGATFALRSLLVVPEWVFLTLLGLAGLIALARVLLHAKGATSALHEIVAGISQPGQRLSGKSDSFVKRMQLWHTHHATGLPAAVPAAVPSTPPDKVPGVTP